MHEKSAGAPPLSRLRRAAPPPRGGSPVAPPSTLSGVRQASAHAMLAKLATDDLTFVRPINRGAHSLVHLVLHRTDGRYYALKVLSKERLACAGDTQAQAVLQEKRALQAVQPHP